MIRRTNRCGTGRSECIETPLRLDPKQRYPPVAFLRRAQGGEIQVAARAIFGLVDIRIQKNVQGRNGRKMSRVGCVDGAGASVEQLEQRAIHLELRPGGTRELVPRQRWKAPVEAVRKPFGARGLASIRGQMDERLHLPVQQRGFAKMRQQSFVSVDRAQARAYTLDQPAEITGIVAGRARCVIIADRCGRIQRPGDRAVQHGICGCRNRWMAVAQIVEVIVDGFERDDDVDVAFGSFGRQKGG